ncbi:MAG: Retroviral aspartyl protease [Methanomassiliicoccales archaeon PtaU1.Bin124]|nr:MAG: Retroviral aspartyl protease [Methanomassiliicoccales archaeon PtaU1.Bin124]
MKRPMIPVTLSNNGEAFEIIGLLDSGADFTAFTKEIAETLNMDLSGPREKAIGVGGEIETVRSKVTISIGKGHEHYSMTVPVKVLLIENSTTPPLLGREGFFDEFRITFEERNKKVYLKKFDKSNRKRKKLPIGK